MTGEGLQLLAQLAAASGVTPVAMAAAVAPGAQHVVGGGEGGEGGEGAGGVGAGSLEVIRACFSRLQGLLREQARLQQELNAVGEVSGAMCHTLDVDFPWALLRCGLQSRDPLLFEQVNPWAPGFTALRSPTLGMQGWS